MLPATAKLLAELLNTSSKTIFKLADTGRIQASRIATAVRDDARLVINWLRKQRAQGWLEAGYELTSPE